MTVSRTNHKTSFVRLFALGDYRLAAIEGLMVEGVNCASIAKQIQTDWDELTDVRRDTLTKQLQRYRDAVVEAKIRVAADRAATRGTTAAHELASFQRNVDTVGCLCELVEMQRLRIHKLYTRELAAEALGDPILRLGTGKLREEMLALETMLRSLGALQLETGLLPRVSRKTSQLPVLQPGERHSFEVGAEAYAQLREATAEAVKIVRGEDPAPG